MCELKTRLNFWEKDPRQWFSKFLIHMGMRLVVSYARRNMLRYEVFEGEQLIGRVDLIKKETLYETNAKTYCEHLYREIKDIYPVRTSEYINNNPLN